MQKVLMDTDLPYLEPLLFWLRADDNLKQVFTEKSFFMPHDDLLSAVQEAIKKDCPTPRALWILPSNTVPLTQSQRCNSPGVHSFYIQIIVQCIRDKFQIVNKGGSLALTGQFMELTKIRNTVKDSVKRFAIDVEKNNIRTFSNLLWAGDTMLYPGSEGGMDPFLITNVEYRVNLY